MRNWVDGILDIESILEKNHTLIFEGAQGLLLDQDGKDFPHVTRSFTGLTNVDHLLRKNEIKVDDDSEVVYVSRAYMTRHGVGPLKNEVEDPDEIGFNVVDETNKHSDYQGSLRFAPLHLDDLIDRIYKDVENNRWNFDVSVAFTCLDQIKDFVRYGSGGFVHFVERNDYLYKLVRNSEYISMGPLWEDIVSTRHIHKFNDLMQGG
jgi:adenylosuccinate synthase